MIAKALNDQFFSETRSRTAENVKDKYKQIGGDNSDDRIVGEWKLQETLSLIKLIEKATSIKILYPLTEIIYKVKDEAGDDKTPEKRFKIKDNKIAIYSKSVKFEEIMNNIVFDIKNVKK